MPAPKINPVRLSALLVAVADGNYFRDAAEAAGIHFTTAYDWKLRGDAALVAGRQERVELDAEIADWINAFPLNYSAENPMWEAPAPMPFTDSDEWVYVLFSVLERRAKAKAVADSIKHIRKAARKGNWQASAWWLERTHYEQFGRKQSIEHSGPEGGPVSIEAVSPEILAERIRELRIKQEGGGDQ